MTTSIFKTKGQRFPITKSSALLGECRNTIVRRAWDKLAAEHPELPESALNSIMATEGVNLICGNQVVHMELRSSGFKCWVRPL